MTKVTELRSDVPPPPLGCHRGKWSGYCVTFVVDGIVYHGKTSDGVRGIDIPCAVVVGDDGIWVECGVK